MAEALLGSTYTYQVLYVDNTGVPIAGILDAAIEIFVVDATGTKIVLASASMVDPVPPETGRFVYPYLINPSTHSVGDTIHAEYTATDPGSGDTLRKNEDVVIVPEFQDGLRARFIE